jgi:hypothetical protein
MEVGVGCNQPGRVLHRVVGGVGSGIGAVELQIDAPLVEEAKSGAAMRQRGRSSCFSLLATI